MSTLRSKPNIKQNLGGSLRNKFQGRICLFESERSVPQSGHDIHPCHGGIRARSSPRTAPARSPPRRSASLAPSASACARARAGRRSEPVGREGRGRGKARRRGGGLRRRSGRRWNPRGLRSRVRPGAGGKPLALLSRDDGQILSGCLVHGFLSGARPGSLHRVENPWLILATGQWVFLSARQEPGSQPASPSSSLMPAKKNVLRLMCRYTEERPCEDTGRRWPSTAKEIGL
ncbi:uncharacterized protein LOC121500926 [Vulpes lagopus]|uniref:uncharacterized protein LOC121500926 n=1 Tax=Vulpes lagopus TaxID=494514 RepID=UPI001BC9C1A2|nr:uncharacterized protein LOC121500926 [Vulpes lagopus]